MENRNLFLLAGLALVGVILWQQWKLDNAPVPAYQPPASASDPGRQPPLPNQDRSVPSALPTSPAVPRTAPQKVDVDTLIRVRTDVLELWIDPEGGTIRRVALIKYKEEAQSEKPFLLGGAEAQGQMLLQGGLVGQQGSSSFSHDTSLYVTERKKYELRADENEISVRLTGQVSDGPAMEKIFTLHRDSYVIDVRYVVDNTDGADHWGGRAYAQMQRVGVKSGWINPSYIGAALSSPEDRYEKKSFSDLQEKRLSQEIEGGWIAWLQHYFISAVLPEAELAAGQRNHYYGFYHEDRYIIGSWTKPVTVAAGDYGQMGHRFYLGPKDQGRLKQAAPHLELTVDYGWLFFLSNLLFIMLVWVHSFLNNWGAAIIVLTFIVKLIFFPLSSASYRSMARIRELQPRVMSMREQYGDDKQAMQREMMRLYAEEKVNPLGGCLPILVQIPVFIALYWVLLESVELRHAGFVFWLSDLSSPDPYFILPLLMGVSMYAQQRLSPQSPDPMQRKILAIMPIPFTLFTVLFPSGLVLYWVVSNILSIAQQAFIMSRTVKKPRGG